MKIKERNLKKKKYRSSRRRLEINPISRITPELF